MRKKLAEFFKKPWGYYPLATCGAVLLYVILTNLSSIWTAFSGLGKTLSPVVTGVIIAYLVDPLCGYFEKRLFKRIKKEKLRRTLSATLALILLVAILTLLIYALVPSIGDNIANIASNSDLYVKNIDRMVTNFTRTAEKYNLRVGNISASWQNALTEIASDLPAKLADIWTTSYNLGSKIASGVIGIIMGIYFIYGKETMLGGVRRLRKSLYTQETYEKRSAFWSRCHEILVHYVVYDLVDGIIVGLLNAILMGIFGMPYIVLISMIVAVTNLIPTFGPVIGAAIGGFILLLNNPVQCLIFLIFTVVLQTIDGYILKPKLFGELLGVPSVWILITVIVGGRMFGIPGILLAIPFAAIFTFVYEEVILPWFVEKRDLREMVKEAREKDHQPAPEEEERVDRPDGTPAESVPAERPKQEPTLNGKKVRKV
ncbi:MAG: AI-2E family transporter [Lachnospiraceae bacterium]|nr:AI-2E family transporter [Lachnospiraceae bacterium]